MRLRERFMEILLHEEIESLLLEAGRSSRSVRADEHAERLAQRFHSMQLSPNDIADEIMAAAAYAGVRANS